MQRKLIAAVAAIAVVGLVGCGETYWTRSSGSDMDAQPQQASVSDWGQGAQNPMEVREGSAQPAGAQMDSEMRSLTAQQFVTKASSAGLYEVQSSQIALSQATDQQTRDFAQQMIDDHRKANDELKQIAQRRGLTVPSSLDSRHQQMLTQIQGQSGEQFSKTYHEQQLKAHEEAVKLFEQASQQLDDQELKTFASKTLPTLQRHLEMCKRFH